MASLVRTKTQVAIVEALQKGGPMAPGELARVLPSIAPSTIRQSLKTLLARGVVARAGQGRYQACDSSVHAAITEVALTVRLPSPVLTRLEALALARSLPRATMAREAMSRGIEAIEQEPNTK